MKDHCPADSTDDKLFKLPAGVLSTVALAASIVLGAATTTLVLLGYGSALAIEQVFSIPARQTYDSTLDLLHLSHHAIAGLMDAITTAGFWKDLALISFAQFVLVFISAIVFITLAWQSRKRRHHLLQGWQRKREHTLASRTRVWSIAGLAIIVSIMPIALTVLLYTATALLIMLPMVGASAAEAHFIRWQVSADHCSPLRSSLERQRSAESSQTNGTLTPCLAIWKGSEKIAEGREVASTQNHIILFDPYTGETARVPNGDAVTRVIGTLSSGNTLLGQPRTKQD